MNETFPLNDDEGLYAAPPTPRKKRITRAEFDRLVETVELLVAGMALVSSAAHTHASLAPATDAPRAELDLSVDAPPA